MPKGVEHVFREGDLEWWMDVNIPLMPKGVEHIRAKWLELEDAG